MAPPRYRGAITMGFHMTLHMGALSATLVNYGTEKIEGGWGWRISLGIAAVPAAVLTLGAPFLEETPNSLIQRKAGDPQKANLVLQKIRGTEDVQAELSNLMNASMVSKSVTHPFKEIMKRKYRPQLVMEFAIPCFQEVTGINVITFYGPILLRTTGLGESASLLSTIVFRVVSAALTFVSMLIVDKVGRRVLFMVGGMQMLTSQMMVGSILATQLGDYGSVSKGYAFALLILICLYVSGFSLSWGPLGRVVPSEIFPLEIRSAGQSITWRRTSSPLWLLLRVFYPCFAISSPGLSSFLGGWLVVMTGFVYLFLPETKNLPIELVDRVWMEHWFWRRIVGKAHEVGKTDQFDN